MWFKSFEKSNSVNQIDNQNETQLQSHITTPLCLNRRNKAEFYQNRNNPQKSKLRQFNSIKIRQVICSNEATNDSKIHKTNLDITSLIGG